MNEQKVVLKKAAGAAAIVQAALSAGGQESFFSMLAVTDAGMMTACILFPFFILWYMFHKRMAARSSFPMILAWYCWI